MAHILVTGANGFIGQHLCRRLLDDGHCVRGMIYEEKPLYFVRQDEMEWFTADLAEPGSLRGSADSIDIVIHCAAIPRNDLTRSWDEFVAINVEGTRALLAECRKAGVERFVFVSTVEAAGYGDGQHPRREGDEPHPDNNYGKSKLRAEQIVHDEAGKVECVVMRLPMIYGPGTLLIVPKLFGMVRWRLYPLIGNGTTEMEFCYVENAVEALTLAAFHKRASSELYYVSDTRSYTIREVITEVGRAMGVRIRFLCIPVPLAMICARLWEMAARIAPIPPLVSRFSGKPFFTRETVAWTSRDVNIVSTEKIRTQLGYQPRISIRKGCEHTARWLRENGGV